MSDLTERIDNWARYYRPYCQVGTCGSAERHFRAPWRQWVSQSDIPYPSPIDVMDAVRIEAAWSALSSKNDKEILRLTYIHRAPDYVIARKCRFPRHKMTDMLRLARYALEQSEILLT